MNKKIVLFALCGTVVTASAMAATWPSDNYMKAGQTYGTAATSEHMGAASGTVTANPWYDISAGYYLKKGTYSAIPCPAGKYCEGVSGISYSASADQGITGDVSAGYYSTGGASAAVATSCNTGGLSGYTSPAGATNISMCYKTDNVSCSTIFPVSANTERSGAIYRNQSNAEITSAVASTRRLMNNFGSSTGIVEGIWAPNSSSQMECLIRGATCNTNYHSNGRLMTISGSSEMNLFVPAGGFSTGSSSASSSYGTNSSGTWGTFDARFGGNASITGVWVKTTENLAGVNLAADYVPAAASVSASGECYCQIQSITRGAGDSGPVLSNWFKPSASSSGTCGYLCTSHVVNNNVADLTLGAYYCYLDATKVLLDPNGATGGTINGMSISSGVVMANCPVGYAIGSETGGSGNMACPWNTTNNGTSITLSKKMFLGWSESASCTTKSCLTTALCPTVEEVNSENAGNASNQKTYYAVWATPTCTADSTSVSATSLKSVSSNKAVCNMTSKTGYYGSTFTGGTGVTSVTATATKCPTNWTSAAGATKESDCYRNITLNKNGGTVKSGKTVQSTVKCNYGIACSFGAAELEQTGQTFTGGWGTTADCTDTTTSFTNPGVATYYACKSANSIVIKWTGVKTAGTGFTAVSGESNAYTSTVSYGGDVVTPAAAVVAATGQTFLGWKFVKAN